MAINKPSSVYFPPELNAKLERIAEHYDRSFSAQVVRVCNRFVRRFERKHPHVAQTLVKAGSQATASFRKALGAYSGVLGDAPQGVDQAPRPRWWLRNPFAVHSQPNPSHPSRLATPGEVVGRP